MSEIPVKTKQEIEIMKKGGKIAALVLKTIQNNIKPGMTTKELDAMAEDIITKNGGKFSFKGFGGFPATTCISINEEVVHGIPSDRVIKEGDIVGVDVGVLFDGYHTDTAITIGVGKITPNEEKLLQVTKESLDIAIKNIRPGVNLGTISQLIQKHIEDNGFGVVRDLSGHGIGTKLQEQPSIPNFGSSGSGPVLREGNTLAIEPMVTSGKWQVNVKPDGWTVVTADGSKSAHFEHTIAVTKKKAEILTKL